MMLWPYEPCLPPKKVAQVPKRNIKFLLLQGILAGNIFDWGAKACVELYTNGTILDMFAEVCCVLLRLC
jgi:hypothetical protein